MGDAGAGLHTHNPHGDKACEIRGQREHGRLSEPGRGVRIWQETQILEDPFSAASMLIFAMHNVVFSECHIFSN